MAKNLSSELVKILLVEDSEHLRRYVTIALKREGYAVDTASDGADGLWHAESFAYDVILLDIMLPLMDGITVLNKLRKQGNATHVLMLTAKDSIEDRVNGLQTGADDYLIKPFDISELIARIQALARRSYKQKSPLISVAGCSINTVNKTVEIKGAALTLTRREFQTLEYLARRKNEVVTRTEIEEHIYDIHADIMSNAVNSAISILRKKLSQHGAEDLIQTRRGIGYCMSDH